MKKIIAAVVSVIIVLGLTACGEKETPEKYAAVVGAYSINSTDKKFILEVQDLGGIYSEVYDKNGVIIEFYGGKDNIYDKDGKRISRSDLTIGSTLEVQYDGTLAKNNPKTIKAYKIIVKD